MPAHDDRTHSTPARPPRGCRWHGGRPFGGFERSLTKADRPDPCAQVRTHGTERQGLRGTNLQCTYLSRCTRPPSRRCALRLGPSRRLDPASKQLPLHSLGSSRSAGVRPVYCREPPLEPAKRPAPVPPAPTRWPGGRSAGTKLMRRYPPGPSLASWHAGFVPPAPTRWPGGRPPVPNSCVGTARTLTRFLAGRVRATCTHAVAWRPTREHKAPARASARAPYDAKSSSTAAATSCGCSHIGT